MVQSEKHECGVQQCSSDNTIATVNKFASWFKLVCFLEVSLQFAEEAEVTGACFPLRNWCRLLWDYSGQVLWQSWRKRSVNVWHPLTLMAFTETLLQLDFKTQTMTSVSVCCPSSRLSAHHSTPQLSSFTSREWVLSNFDSVQCHQQLASWG